MKIRPAKFSDSKEIVKIWNPYIKNTFVTFNASEKTQEEVCALIKERRSNGREFWVACKDDEINGCAYQTSYAHHHSTEDIVKFFPDFERSVLNRLLLLQNDQI